MTQQALLRALITKGPGRTEVELAKAIHGPSGYQQQVNQDCSMLVGCAAVERRGDGGVTDPFTYWPI